MNPWLTAIQSGLSLLERTDFKRKLPATIGCVLFDYVHQKYRVEVPKEVEMKLWLQVVTDYTEKYKSYPDLFKTPARDNRSIINQYKGELVRAFLFNNKHIFNELNGSN